MRKHIRTSLALLVVALAAASFMLMLPGCTGGTNDSPGKPDAVGNRSADGASEATQGDIVSTAMVAYANGDQDLMGTIEAGKFADMVVIDRDIFHIPENDIKDIQVLNTYMAGIERYHRD